MKMNLQFFASAPNTLKVNFDSNITKVEFETLIGTAVVTTSGTTIDTNYNDGDVETVSVTLNNGYVINTAVITDISGGSYEAGGSISNISDNSFNITASFGGIGGVLTITSKQVNTNLQIPITKNGTTTLATKGTKNVEDIDINVNISPIIQSLSITPSETSQTFNASSVDGYKPVTVSAISTETPTVALSLASGNQTVNASSGKYIKSLTITKPSTLIASNIKSGVNIAGVNGSLSPAKPEQAKIITITENGSQSVTPDSGQVLSSVSITTNVPTYITVASESALPSTAQEGTIAVVGGGVMYKLNFGNGDSTSTTFNIQVDDNASYTQTVPGGGGVFYTTNPLESTQVQLSIANYNIIYRNATDCIVEIPTGEEDYIEHSYIIVKPQSNGATILLKKGGRRN